MAVVAPAPTVTEAGTVRAALLSETATDSATVRGGGPGEGDRCRWSWRRS